MTQSEAPQELGRRERQIMDIVFRLGQASVAEVRRELADPPTYSAVRGMLRLLEDKGHLTHESDGLRYLYKPTLAQNKAQRSAMQHLVHTFFGGSAADAVVTLLELPDASLSAEDRERLTAAIRKARSEGR